MYRRDVLVIAFAAGISILPGVTLAQQPTQQQRQQPAAQPAPQKPMKELVLGAWTLLLADGKKADNTETPLFGPNPVGSLIFTDTGRFSSQLMRTINRPPFKSNNRDTGTAEENKDAAQGTLSFFGSYTVDEAGKAINVHIEGSTFPNQEGTRAKWQVTAITDDVLQFEIPIAQTSVPGAQFTSIQNIWRKAK